MLEDRVLYYYRNDYNCAQCMLMGAIDEYGLPIECCCVDMCAGAVSYTHLDVYKRQVVK